MARQKYNFRYNAFVGNKRLTIVEQLFHKPFADLDDTELKIYRNILELRKARFYGKQPRKQADYKYFYDVHEIDYGDDYFLATNKPAKRIIHNAIGDFYAEKCENCDNCFDAIEQYLDKKDIKYKWLEFEIVEF